MDRLRLARTRLVERQSGPRVRQRLHGKPSCMLVHMFSLQCKSEIVWLLKSELTHSLLIASNYGVFIIIVTLQHAQIGVEEVI